MSFSGDVKRELAKQFKKSRHCQLAELAGMLEMTGSVQGNPLLLQLDSENQALVQKYALLMKQAFALDIEKPIEMENTIRILKELKWYEEEEAKKLPLQQRCVNEALLKRECCRRAFIRGAFLAAGSMSDPEKSYHFEVSCKTREQAMQLQRLMCDFGTDAKWIERKGHYVVYLKEGSQIVDMLNVMEAHVSLMNLENVRIMKDMRNSINRRVNCDTANINKTANAAVKQLADIRKIQKMKGLDDLPRNLREMAYLRLENPEATLKELGEMAEPPVGKSGVNHRLRKLGEIADTL